MHSGASEVKGYGQNTMYDPLKELIKNSVFNYAFI